MQIPQKCRLRCKAGAFDRGREMPAIAAHAFTDPDEFYSAIRNWVEGFVTERGDYRAEFTRVDFSRLWISRGEET